MKHYMRFSVVLPLVSSLIIGIVLFLLGMVDDAPGLCLIGITIAFLLIFWGICNAGFIKKSQIMYILLLCFGIGCLIMSVVLLLDGEFEEKPYVFLIGVLLGTALLCVGIAKWIKNRQSNNLIQC